MNPLLLIATLVVGYAAGYLTGPKLARVLSRRRRVTHVLPVPLPLGGLPHMHMRRRDVLLAIATALAVGSLVAALLGVAKDHSQDRLNTHRNKALLQCVSATLDDLIGSLPPVRAASAKRDDATAIRDAALNRVTQAFGDLLVGLANRTVDSADDLDPLRTALVDLSATSQRLIRAQNHLEKVRAANPYPESPLDRCASLLENPDATPESLSSLPPVTLPSLSPRRSHSVVPSPLSSPAAAPQSSPPGSSRPSSKPTTPPVGSSPHPTPSPTPTPSPSGLVGLVDNTLKQLGLPTLPFRTP